MRGVGHDGDNDVSILRHFGAVRANLRALADELRRSLLDVSHVELVTTIQQVAGHRGTHNAQTNETNFRHVFLQKTVATGIGFRQCRTDSPSKRVAKGQQREPASRSMVKAKSSFVKNPKHRLHQYLKYRASQRQAHSP